MYLNIYICKYMFKYFICMFCFLQGYIYIYVCLVLYIYIFMNKYIYIYIHIYTCIHTYIYIDISMSCFLQGLLMHAIYQYACEYARIYTYRHTCM